MSIKKIKITFCLILTALLFSVNSLNAQDKVDTANAIAKDTTEKTEVKTGFQPGPFIIHHILDAHYWHIAEIGESKIEVPLPVILISNKGLDVFMFSKFQPIEGKAEGDEEVMKYNGYIYEKGKIKAEDGSAVYDLSITKNVLALMISAFLLCFIFFSISKSYKKNQGHAPKGLQSLIEPLILFIRDDIAKPSIGEKKYMRYMPFLLTVFFFIFLNNLMGLIPIFPGGANVTGNIAVTMVLALFTFAITTFSANKSYWIHVVNTPGVPWWLKFPVPLMPLVETMGVITKPFVLMVRLFANITAGHIIILSFVALIFIFGKINIGVGYGVSVVSVLFAVFMSFLELLVAFIQAYVFTLLSALYFGMATEEHHAEEHH